MTLLDQPIPSDVLILIDKINREEAIDEVDLMRLSLLFVGSQKVRDLVNPAGRQILKGDANVLPL